MLVREWKNSMKSADRFIYVNHMKKTIACVCRLVFRINNIMVFVRKHLTNTRGELADRYMMAAFSHMGMVVNGR